MEFLYLRIKFFFELFIFFITIIFPFFYSKVSIINFKTSIIILKICHQLEDRLSEIEALIFKILNKHGIKDIFEVDEYFKTDKIAESDGWEDFFELDGLMTEKQELIEIKEKI